MKENVGTGQSLLFRVNLSIQGTTLMTIVKIKGRDLKIITFGHNLLRELLMLSKQYFQILIPVKLSMHACIKTAVVCVSSL